MEKETAQEKFRELCREHGSKFTVQRFAVYFHIRENKSHPNVDQIWEAVRREIPSITRESVFRILSELASWGVIYRMDQIVNARFDGVSGNHGHLICRLCGKVIDFPLPESMPLAPDENGFSPEHVELRVSGICAACAGKKKLDPLSGQ